MKNLFRIISILVIAFSFLTIFCTPFSFAQDPSGKPNSLFIGQWKEYWGVKGQTDVTYHDRYQVTRTENGHVQVEILNRKQAIFDIRTNGNALAFSQKTHAFIVKYELTILADGKWMIGTATTPERTVDIKWEKVK